MKIAEIRDLTADQLNDRLVELKKEQFNLRFQKASGQLPLLKNEFRNEF